LINILKERVTTIISTMP